VINYHFNICKPVLWLQSSQVSWLFVMIRPLGIFLLRAQITRAVNN